MKKRMVGIVSLFFILIAYGVFRYPLFAWHGMKQLPLYLLVAGIAVITISGIIKGNKIASVFTATGYIVGFFVGYLLSASSYDPGGGLLNNMWQIWTYSYGSALIAGVLIESLHMRARQEAEASPCQ